jgi:hypothetical protein
MPKLALKLPWMSSGHAIYVQHIEIRTNRDKEHVMNDYVLGNFATRQDLKDSANLADVNAGKDTWPPEKIACQPISTPQRYRLTNRFRPKRGRNEYFHNRETHPIDR